MINRNILIDQLDAKMIILKDLLKITLPNSGWVNAIRTALNMTLKQLGVRMSMTGQSVKEIEQREKEGTVSLNVLKKFAKAMNMKFVYGFIPIDGSLDKIVESRAYELAKEIVKRTSVNMSLEDQKNSEKRIQKAIDERAKEIKREMPKYLWD